MGHVFCNTFYGMWDMRIIYTSCNKIFLDLDTLFQFQSFKLIEYWLKNAISYEYHPKDYMHKKIVVMSESDDLCFSLQPGQFHTIQS